MRHLFFVIAIVSICATKSIVVIAQTAVNFKHKSNSPNSSQPLKFIEHIQITPGGYSSGYQNGSVQLEKTSTIAKPVKAMDASIEKCSSLQFKYAQLMDVEVETVNNIKLFNTIEEWWGTPYRYGGVGKNGIDCSAFCGKIFESAYQQTLPRTAHEQYKLCSKIDKADLQEGDLVFFNTRGGVSHVGIYLGNNNFAHSSTKNGVTINSLTDDYYNRKFIGGGRVK